MKDYVEYCKIPCFEFKGKKIPALFLGDSRFRYGGRYQNCRCGDVIPQPEIVEIMKETIKLGIPAIAVSEEKLLKAVKDASAAIGVNPAIFLHRELPLRVNGSKAEFGKVVAKNLEILLLHQSFKKKLKSDPILAKFYSAFRHMKPYRDDELETVEINQRQWKNDASMIASIKPNIISIGGDALDMLILTNRTNLVKSFYQKAQRLCRLENVVLVASSHIPTMTISVFDREGISCDGYLFPINKYALGIYSESTEFVSLVDHELKLLVAMKPLGGGSISPTEAFAFLFNETHIQHAVIGIGSPAEARDTFGVAKEILSRSGKVTRTKKHTLTHHPNKLCNRLKLEYLDGTP